MQFQHGLTVLGDIPRFMLPTKASAGRQIPKIAKGGAPDQKLGNLTRQPTPASPPPVRRAETNPAKGKPKKRQSTPDSSCVDILKGHILDSQENSDPTFQAQQTSLQTRSPHKLISSALSDTITPDDKTDTSQSTTTSSVSVVGTANAIPSEPLLTRNDLLKRSTSNPEMDLRKRGQQHQHQQHQHEHPKPRHRHIHSVTIPRVSVLSAEDFDQKKIFDNYYNNLDAILFEQKQQSATQNTPPNQPTESIMSSAEASVKKLNEKRRMTRMHHLVETLHESQDVVDLVLRTEKAQREQLAVRMMELQCSVRRDLSDAEALEGIKHDVAASIEYLERLERLAAGMGVLKGALFQECLGRGKDLPRKFMLMATYPTGVVPIEKFLSAEEEEALVIGTISICGLVRVKLADDNDLHTGATILSDSRHFLAELADFAVETEQSEWEACCALSSLLSKGKKK